MKLEGMVGSNITTNANNFPELKTRLWILKAHNMCQADWVKINLLFDDRL